MLLISSHLLMHLCCLLAGDGEHVADSPYPVLLVPGPPHPRNSLVTGSGRSLAVAGSAATFDIIVQDAYGNRCNVASDESSTQEFHGAAVKTRAEDAIGATALTGDRISKQLCLEPEQSTVMQPGWLMEVQVTSSTNIIHQSVTCCLRVSPVPHTVLLFLVVLIPVRELYILPLSAPPHPFWCKCLLRAG